MIRILKKHLRTGINYTVEALLPKLKMHANVNSRILGNEGHFFVGYYDIDPLSISGDKLLCHKVLHKYSNLTEPTKGLIGLISIDSNEFSPLAETQAINWQLGSRVQWLSEDMVIYNDVENNRQCSKILNLKSNNIDSFYVRPFWAISPSKKWSVSLNFARLRDKRPGYGYSGDNIDENHEMLTVFDLSSSDINFQVELSSLLKQIDFKCPFGVDPYLNHIAWSPCSSKFLTLFHFDDPVSQKRTIYPVLINLSDQTAILIHAEGYFSHHVWLDSEHLLAYVKLNGKPCFAVWEKELGWVEVRNSMPILDGHPSIVPGTKKIVVDSYPDRLGRMSLYLGSVSENDNLTKICSVTNSVLYSGALRCDLHPRVSIENNMIVCDVPFKKGRKILLVEGVVGEK